MNLRRSCITLVAAGGLWFPTAGCARAGGAEPATANAPARSSDVITQAELASDAVSGGDALEAVRRLRPRFLATRGRPSILVAGAGQLHVSLDGGPLQTVDLLSRMRPGELSEIRYLSAPEAAQRFGTASGAGPVILLKTK